MLWLLPATVKFPRQHRFVLAEAIQRSALQLHEALTEAALSKRPQGGLQRADIELSKLRVYLRLSRDLELLKTSQYKYASAMVDEIGRLLGGWRKTPTSP
jgi:hypothetical protein